MVQYLILVWSVHTYILRRAVVGNLVVEGGKLRHLDEIAKTLLLNDIVRYVELKIGRLFGEDGSPSIETADVLPFQFVGAQVFEEQVQFRQTVGNGRARKERSPQVLARPLLYGADGKEHVQGFLATLAVAQSRHTVVPRVKRKILELVRQIRNFGFEPLSELSYFFCLTF